MQLALLDWLIIVGFLAFSVGAGMVLSRRGSRSIDDYFVSGRRLPWWLAGISMVATGFAIDTPLGITGLVAGQGIQGVWYAWAAIMGGAGVFGAFIFAALMRRSRVVTLAELIELRYSGSEAAYLRLFKAIYIGILANAITLGWVIKAVFTVCESILPAWDPMIVLGGVLLFTLVYTALSGMWGIAATDFLQYFISTAGSLTLAYFAIRHVGGVGGILEGMATRYGPQEAVTRLQFLPRWGTDFFVTFVVFMTLKWWVDMPGAISQRVLSSRDERHASMATMFFATVHFAMNYWPMILVALVSLIVYPELEHAEHGYPLLMVRLLPTGLLGLMLAAMMAAFMSTVDTHINMGASYIVKDIYQRFLVPEASRKHYVWAGRAATVLMLGFAVGIALNLDSVKDAWYTLTLLFAGYGFVTVARWFWWRVNAWSEISAMLGSFGFSMLVRHLLRPSFPELFDTFGWRFLVIFAGSTIVWVTVTLCTKPSAEQKLVSFCQRVKPYPLLWGPIRKNHPEIEWSPFLGLSALHFLIAAVMIYGVCFGLGHLLFQHYVRAVALLAVAAASGAAIALTWRYRAYERPDEAEVECAVKVEPGVR
jgi:Na+/proline symporter